MSNEHDAAVGDAAENANGAEDNDKLKSCYFNDNFLPLSQSLCRVSITSIMMLLMVMLQIMLMVMLRIILMTNSENVNDNSLLTKNTADNSHLTNAG